MLVEHFSEKGDLILDLFAGSGVFGLTALAMNRNVVFVEIEETLCKEIENKCKMIHTVKFKNNNGLLKFMNK